MKKIWILVLPLLALFVTGCPRNEYVVTLNPQGERMERTLVFYRADSSDTNGPPKYESFPEDQLAAIAALYPSNGISLKGDVHIAKGEFGQTMPSDVGGAGNYTNVVTSMGSAGFYAERFRGDDDPAGQIEKRIAAANQLADLVLGWSQAELGAETNYPQLRQFLDNRFRRDLKNAALYWRQAAEFQNTCTNIDQEYVVRFALYMLERGYYKLGDVPVLLKLLDEDNETKFMAFIQRLVAQKLGVADTQPVPASLAFLHDMNSMSASFSNYFIGTSFYREKIKEWEKKQEPPEKKPNVDDIIFERIFSDIMGISLSGEPEDHLTVTLSLPVSPAHTNGKWDETKKQVVWDYDLESRTNAVQLPVICYASWEQPDETFQKLHFGSVFLTSENLTLYCLWRAGLDEKRAAEWDKFLVDLRPSDSLKQLVKGFRFSDEQPVDSDVQKSPSWRARTLLEESLAEKPLEAAK